MLADPPRGRRLPAGWPRSARWLPAPALAGPGGRARGARPRAAAGAPRRRAGGTAGGLVGPLDGQARLHPGGRGRRADRPQRAQIRERSRGGLPRDHLVGQPDQRGQAALGRGPEPDLDAVPGGQPGDHEQAHPAGHRDVHDRRVVQPPVGVRHLLGAHPDALVGDVQQRAAAVEQVPRHVHQGFRGGERGRVLGQLGQQVHDVVDRLPADRDARLDVRHDPLVVLDLGHRRAQHVHQRHRLGPPPGQLVARQDQQVLGVAPHPGGQVVHLEQVRQPLGILLALLQVVDQPDLAFHQRLAPAGQVHEHRVDVAAQRGLVGRQPHRLPVHLVERPGDLTDLVGGVHVDRLDLQRRSAPPPPLIRRTVSGSRTPATSSAPVRSRCSGRVMDRPRASGEEQGQGQDQDHREALEQRRRDGPVPQPADSAR